MQHSWRNSVLYHILLAVVSFRLLSLAKFVVNRPHDSGRVFCNFFCLVLKLKKTFCFNDESLTIPKRKLRKQNWNLKNKSNYLQTNWRSLLLQSLTWMIRQVLLSSFCLLPITFYVLHLIALKTFEQYSKVVNRKRYIHIKCLIIQ